MEFFFFGLQECFYFSNNDYKQEVQLFHKNIYFVKKEKKEKDVNIWEPYDGDCFIPYQKDGKLTSFD